MKHRTHLPVIALIITASLAWLRADEPAAKSPMEVFSGALAKLVSIVEPPMEGSHPTHSIPPARRAIPNTTWLNC
jgi:hypothetical protein